MILAVKILMNMARLAITADHAVVFGLREFPFERVFQIHVGAGRRHGKPNEAEDPADGKPALPALAPNRWGRKGPGQMFHDGNRRKESSPGRGSRKTQAHRLADNPGSVNAASIKVKNPVHHRILTPKRLQIGWERNIS
jgi:hypothetical protein